MQRSRASNSTTSSRRNVVPSYSASVSAPFATANSASLRGGTVHASSLATHSGFESRILAQRSNAMQAESLSSYHSNNTALISSAESEERAAHLRKVRRLQQQNAEWALHYDLENEQREKERRLILHAQDQMLAKALLTAEAERTFEENERRRVCEGSEEIAQLTDKLKAARINAERHSQLLHRQAVAAEEKESDVRLEAEAEKERRAHAELEKVKAAEAIEAGEERARVLRLQCEEKEQAKVTAYEDFLQEKRSIDSIVQRIAAEDAEKAAKKRKAQEELQAVIGQYLTQRQQWRAEEEKKALAELAAIAAYTADMEQRRQAQALKMKEKNERDDVIYAAISSEMERKEKEREDMERMLEELYVEQKEQEMLHEVERQQKKVEAMRRDMQRENEAVQERKRQVRLRQQEAERELQQRMQRQMEADAAFEAASREKRARLKVQYQAEIAATLRQKAEAAEAEQRREEEVEEAKRKAAQREVDIVEAERERLLMELATHLQPFLPKGVYRDAAEKTRIFNKINQANAQPQRPVKGHKAAAASSSLPQSFPTSFAPSLSPMTTSMSSSTTTSAAQPRIVRRG